MPRLLLSFFGVFQTELDGQHIHHFRSANVQGLLIYLALQAERPFPREQLATLFWPDKPDSVAKKNLRQTIYQLRQILSDSNDAEQPFLLVARQSVQFNANADTAVDVHQFIRALENGELEKVRDLYQGELLPGFTCDSLEFESWLRQERERLHRLAMKAIDDLTNRQMHTGDPIAAQISARRQIQLEPWRETAHRQLMQALALAGEREAALAHFDLCQAILEEELGAEPDETTVALFQQIQNNELAPASPDLIAEQYKLGKQIGQGSMGTVFKGEHYLTGKPVAIKMLDGSKAEYFPEFVERFKREGEVLRQLNHPNIVKLLGIDSKDSHHYLVMEYIAGGDLQQYLANQPRLPVEQALAIALDLADALTRAHSLDILHRDLKPANILLDGNDKPYLTDFGVARLGKESDLTQTGVVIGTYAYLSPEACKGAAQDKRSDIWSFGIILYEMLAGKRPFSGATSPATLIAILQDPLPDIRLTRPDLPNPLNQLLDIMLTKERDERIGSIRQVATIIEAILNGKDTTELLAPFGTATTPFGTASSAPPQISTKEEITLPPVSPTFVGRVAELSHIIQTFQNTTCRFLTLTGIGGIGKSRLAIEVAHKFQTETDAEVTYLALDKVQNQQGIAQQLAQAVDLPNTSSEQQIEEIVTHLTGKKRLLLLDNVEKAVALDATGMIAFLNHLLQALPQLRILMTSRQPLQAQAEWVFPVRGLPVPPTSTLERNQWWQYAAISLFERQAQQSDITFALTSQNIQDVIQLIQWAEGSPLTLERLAKQTRQQSVAEIRQAVHQAQQSIRQHKLSLTPFMQSLTTTFITSWQLLTDEEQAILAQTAVFQAGFSRAAARSLLNEGANLLEDLVDKSLLLRHKQNNQMGQVRYHLPHLLQLFLQEQSAPPTQLKDDHAAYYLNWAGLHPEHIVSELANIQAGWAWAQKRPQLELPRRWDANLLDDIVVTDTQAVSPKTTFRKTAVLVGRDAEINSLRESLYDMTHNHQNGGLITILGKAGVGKTHLINQLKTEQTGQTWFLAPCDETHAHTLQPFRQWLRDYFGQTENSDNNLAVFNVHFEDLIESIPNETLQNELQENKSFLAALVDIQLPNSAYMRLKPEQRLEHFQRAIKTLIKAESLLNPVVLHLEDAHWLDAESRHFMQYLLRHVNDYPFLILLTSRPEHFEPLLLLDLPQKTIRLDTLTRDEIRQLAHIHINAEPASELIDLLIDRTQGNPFYTEQILLYLRENGLVFNGELVQTPGYSATDQLLPLDIHNLLVARLNLLEKSTQDMVAQAAVLGHEFSLPILRKMIKGDVMQQGLLDGTQAAIWQPIGPERYAFNHAFLREAAYNVQFTERKQELHAQAAQAVTAVSTADHPHFGTIAHHLDEANNPARAANYYRKAGDEAKENYFIREAHNYYSRGLKLAQTDKQRLKLYLGREQVNHWLGNREQQQEDLNNLLPLIQKQGEKSLQMELSLRRASYALATAHYDQAIRHAQQATALAAAVHDRALEASAYQRWGRALWQQGKAKAAEPILKRAQMLAKAAADSSIQAQCLYDLGIIAFYQNQFAQATQQIEEAIELFKELDDRHNMVRCQDILGSLAINSGRYEEAIQIYEQTLALCQTIDWPYGEAYVLAHFADCYFELGQYSQSRQLHQEVVLLAKQLNDRVAESVSLDTIGLTYHFEKQYQEAQQHFEMALALHATINYPRGKAFILNHFGLLLANQEEIEQAGIYLYEALMLRGETTEKPASMDTEAALAWLDMARGDIDFAMMRAQEVLSWLQENGTSGVELPLQVYWQCHTIFKLANQQVEAESCLEAAYQLLQSQADQLQDNELKQSFLHNVPYHQRIWQTWQTANLS